MDTNEDQPTKFRVNHHQAYDFVNELVSVFTKALLDDEKQPSKWKGKCEKQ